MPQEDLFGDANALPSGLVYQPGLLSAAEEAEALAGIATLELREAQYKEYTARRRVASFGAGYDFDANELTPAPVMASFLLPLRDKAARFAGIDPEALGYALVAEYRPGTQLGWHRDVPQFETVVGLSLAGLARMRFRRFPPKPRGPIYTLDLAPRSGYVLQGEARWGWQHSIAATPELRYSITFRTRRA
ncbi:MAG TPA: alpha-ketoglutarate-dependent dioxygenase AlkB [Usitatibacter sp.]|nr:alpha-ketoglutarate-dependent dioxygenase AlkB [Usitatibacter sp.]